MRGSKNWMGRWRSRHSAATAWVAAAMIAASFVLVPAAEAVEPYVQPFTSEVTSQTFNAGDHRVGVSASSWRSVGDSRTGDVCVSAQRTEESGDTRTTVGQYGCVYGAEYRFDPLEWRATVVGAGRVWVTEHVTRFHDGEWHHESFRVLAEDEPVRFDLAWSGVGEVNREQVVYPYSCYCLPPVGVVVMVISSRDAVVSGSIHFDGIDLAAEVPPDHPGSMRWGAP